MRAQESHPRCRRLTSSLVRGTSARSEVTPDDPAHASDPARPGSLASFVRLFTEPAIVRAREHLDDSVRTGDIACDAVFGTDFFSHLAQHPELSAELNAAMIQAVSKTAAAVPYAFDFGRFTKVTDVGRATEPSWPV